MRPAGYLVSPHVAQGAIWVWDPALENTFVLWEENSCLAWSLTLHRHHHSFKNLGVFAAYSGMDEMKNPR